MDESLVELTVDRLAYKEIARKPQPGRFMTKAVNPFR